MSNLDVILEKIHLRHDPRWSARGVCVACVLELMDREDVSIVRKSAALADVLELLKIAGLVRDVFQQDERVCLHFICSLMKMLKSVEDLAVLEQIIQVLVQLLLDLKEEHFVQYVLDELQTQLCKGAGGKFFPHLTFLGKLVDAVSFLAQMLTTTHLECMCACMLNPDEALKSAVCYVFRGVWASEAALQSLPHTLRERVCVLLLHTLTHTCSLQLTINCLGLLLLMLRGGETVCLLMNQKKNPPIEEEEESQCTELSNQHCSLPLILKRMLLGGDECVQVVSVRCVSAVLTHFPSQYCASFIQADLPEFLFERLSSNNEVLLWSVYGCLLLLCEDAAFFSQCHSIYGIESLVRSLKAVFKLSNLEVQKKGLQLLTAILERQPTSLRLFPTVPGFVGVAEVVQGAVTSSCFRVATQAAQAATALFRLHHQSSPVHFGELKRIVEALTSRCAELPLHITSQRRRCFPDSESGQSFRAGVFLIQALTCFQEACRLAEECVTEASVKENTLIAPDKQSEDTLESLCVCLLHCCDTAYIPVVTRLCERVPSPQVLQLFFSVLSMQFSLSPSLTPTFATKLASSGFIRLAVEHKALLCSGNRHSSLNAACCGFLLKLCVCLLSQPRPVTGNHQQDVEEVEYVLRECLPSLWCRVCDWPSVLLEVPEENQNTQFCLLHLLYLSLLHGDRLLPDATVFSSVVNFLCVMQEQHDSLPPSVLKPALYLLGATQESNPDLDWAALNSISNALSSTPLAFSPLSSPHPALLHFIFRYSALAERFGMKILSSWLAGGLEPAVCGENKQSGPDLEKNVESSVLLELLEKKPSTILSLLGVLCDDDGSVARQAVQVLRCYLQAGRSCSSAQAHLLKPALLKLLQRLTCDSEDNTVLGSLILEVLCSVQNNLPAQSNMDNTDFKLLYHVSNLVGKVKCNNSEFLLPALNYLYCCLTLCPPHTADRVCVCVCVRVRVCARTVVSMLLSNTGVMELLQVVLNLLSSPSSVISSSSLICCCLLLLSSLITLQHTFSAQVHKSVCLELEIVVKALTFHKRHTDNLVLVCVVRLVQAVLDVDLSSPVVRVSECLRLHRPLQPVDGALHPLGYTGATSLVTALQSLLLQKQEMLLNASVNCLRSLIGFLHRRKPTIAQHVVCQPWNRFLLYSLLNSGENLALHPATLSLLTLSAQSLQTPLQGVFSRSNMYGASIFWGERVSSFSAKFRLLVHWSGGVTQWDSDVACVCVAAEKRGVKELRENTVHTLKLLLTECSAFSLSEQLNMRVHSLLESLDQLPPTETNTRALVHIGSLSICPADFAVNTHPFTQ
ncbi:meiosis inhibitor protein 1 [Colossoma macropomum]|uniref:meiosis inhibitor protein 1 n=1 Tax=Colossoma macropomum TaxID=42526 RepID=UPI0018647DBA|nr:meiosis inhibitor protein 1 [Colossoma macropomum]